MALPGDCPGGSCQDKKEYMLALMTWCGSLCFAPHFLASRQLAIAWSHRGPSSGCTRCWRNVSRPPSLTLSGIIHNPILLSALSAITLGDTQNRPMRDTSKPANRNSRTLTTAGTYSPSSEQCLERRKTTTSPRAWPSRVAAAAHPTRNRRTPGDGKRLSQSCRHRRTTSTRLGKTPASFKTGQRVAPRLWRRVGPIRHSGRRPRNTDIGARYVTAEIKTGQ